MPCNRKRTKRHFDRFDLVGLLLHFRARRQTFFRQLGVMTLAYINNHVWNVVISADMVGLKTERTDFSRRTSPLAGVAKNSLGGAPDHSTPPVLAYKFSIFISPALALSKITAASAKTSWPAIRTPSHLASKLSALILPRSNLSRSRKNSERFVAAREPRIRTGTSPDAVGNRRLRMRLSALLARTRLPRAPRIRSEPRYL